MSDEHDERSARPEIKVTDKRMFTAEGELREEYRQLQEAAKEEAGKTPAEAADRAPGAPSRPASGAAAAPSGGRRDEPLGGPGAIPTGSAPGEHRQGGPAGASPGRPHPDASPPPLEIPDMGPGPQAAFFDLVGMLAEPAAIYLGDARLPDGGTAENLEAARLHIDLLDVLRRKTAGNLSAQESAVLEDVLYRLRMRYVQKRG